MYQNKISNKMAITKPATSNMLAKYTIRVMWISRSGCNVRLTDYNTESISHLSMPAAWLLILNITLTRAIGDWYSVKLITLKISVFLPKLNNVPQEGVSTCPHHVTCIFLGVGAVPHPYSKREYEFHCLTVHFNSLNFIYQLMHLYIQ